MDGLPCGGCCWAHDSYGRECERPAVVHMGTHIRGCTRPGCHSGEQVCVGRAASMPSTFYCHNTSSLVALNASADAHLQSTAHDTWQLYRSGWILDTQDTITSMCLPAPLNTVQVRTPLQYTLVMQQVTVGSLACRCSGPYLCSWTLGAECPLALTTMCCGLAGVAGSPSSLFACCCGPS